jgi:folylpolyglutamate synthase
MSLSDEQSSERYFGVIMSDLEVVFSRVAAQASSYTVVPKHPSLGSISLGLAGEHQTSNASLAIALAQAFLSTPFELPPSFTRIRLPSAVPSSPAASEATLPSLPSTLVSPDPLPASLAQGLEQAKWPGRCQIVEDRDEGRKGVTWYLDGAHTAESLVCCSDWFAGQLSPVHGSEK